MAPTTIQHSEAEMSPTQTTNTSRNTDSDSTFSAEDHQDLEHLSTHVSHTHDAPITQYTSHIEIPDEVYARLSPSRKHVIVCLLAFCSFLAPISSTTVLSAVPEVAATFDTTGTIVNLTNAVYMVSRNEIFKESGN